MNLVLDLRCLEVSTPSKQVKTKLTKKPTTPFGFVKEARTQGETSLLILEKQTGKCRES